MRTAPARPVASHPIPWHPLEKKKSFSRISGAKSQGEEDIRYKWPAAAREEGSANETYVICSQAFLLFFITVSINGKAEWSRHQRHWLPFIEVTHWGCASIDVPINNIQNGVFWARRHFLQMGFQTWWKPFFLQRQCLETEGFLF